ncbi:hypothetical protein BLOT_016477, partial [Blomia tropicalis]
MDEQSFKSLTSHKGQKVRTITIEEKLKIVSEAKIAGNRPTSRIRNISESCIRDWRKKENELKLQLSKRKRMVGGGRKPFNEDLEIELENFIISSREKKLRVTRKMIRREAVKIWNKTKNDEESNNCEFKGSDGFVDNFLRRHKFSLRRKTTVCQKVPQEHLQKIVNFILYVRNKRIKENYNLQEIYNCDETPIWFEAIGNTTIDKVNSPEIGILTTGHEKMKCSLMLTGKADGSKLKPFVVFKRKRPMPEQEKKFPGLVIGYSNNGWFNEETTNQYIDKVI